MGTTKPTLFMATFAGLALLLVAMGHMMLDIPGASGVKSNFAEVALVISVPFLTRWYHPVLLAAFTVFNVAPDGTLIEALNHVLCFPMVWLAFRRSDRVQGTVRLVLFWIATIALYYFVGLVPSIFLMHLVLGHMDLRAAVAGMMAVDRLVIYEYLATTFVAVFYFVMTRELRDRKAAQQDLEKRNEELLRNQQELQSTQSEREALQEKLFQSQKMEAIGQLAGGIAHDFNNSLGIILGAAELAQMGEMPESSKEYLDMIVTAARRSSSLTRKLLSFSRQGTRSVDMIDAGAIVKDTVSLLQSSIDKRIDLKVENNAVRTNVMGDTGLLQNAFMNLGINASHAMPEGGSIRITLENLHLDRDYCEASPFRLTEGEYLAIRFRDTGCGIPPENLSRIFEPFFTTKAEGKGTGLGLASVFGTIQDHDGAVTVYSEVGKGTVFHVFLPLPPDTLGLYATDEAPQEIPTGTGTILLVDDEEMIRKTASLMLVGLGYRVIVASEGNQAVELFREGSEGIDLVLLDMTMPVLGGKGAFEEIRRTNPGTPVIVCSGFSKGDDLEQMKATGLSGFLQKPFQRAQLARAVAAALADRPAR